VFESGFGASTEPCGLELGAQRSGNGDTYVDLHATASTDYEVRLRRAAGVDGVAELANSGAGSFTISSPAGVRVQGTNTNDSAAAGYVGEFLSATAGSTAATSGAPGAVTSLSLTAGDWDVEGTVLFAAAGTTVVTQVTIGLSTTSGGFAAQGTFGRMDMVGSFTGLTMQLNSGSTRFSLATTTTVFLNYFATFTTSNMNKLGQITARRAR
jgi:hypothetical protein